MFNNLDNLIELIGGMKRGSSGRMGKAYKSIKEMKVSGKTSFFGLVLILCIIFGFLIGSLVTTPGSGSGIDKKCVVQKEDGVREELGLKHVSKPISFQSMALLFSILTMIVLFSSTIKKRMRIVGILSCSIGIIFMLITLSTMPGTATGLKAKIEENGVIRDLMLDDISKPVAFGSLAFFFMVITLVGGFFGDKLENREKWIGLFFIFGIVALTMGSLITLPGTITGKPKCLVKKNNEEKEMGLSDVPVPVSLLSFILCLGFVALFLIFKTDFKELNEIRKSVQEKVARKIKPTD